LDVAFLVMAVSIAITGSKVYALEQYIFKGNKVENTTTIK